jgi:DNA topoisomerase-3
MIAREIIDLCGYRGPIQRLWLSALNDASIRKALGALKPSAETLPMYYSALARSRADWLIGMNLSRLFTVARAAGRLSGRAVGRPGADADAEAGGRSRPRDRRFVSVPYWASRSRCLMPAKFHRKLDAADRVVRTMRAAACSSRWPSRPPSACAPPARPRWCRSRPSACAKVRRCRSTWAPCRKCVRKQLGLDVQETLDIAQALYETHKATTYPRSDSGYLPESMLAEVPTVLDSLLKTDPGLRPLIDRLDRPALARLERRKVTAHHGIIPTLEPANLSAMNEKELAVYRLIRAHYLAQFLPHHEFDRTVAQLACGGQSLVAVGKQIAVAGWRQVLAAPEESDAGARRRPAQPGAAGAASRLVLPGRPVDLKALKTLPPKPYTQGELVKAMKGVAKLVTDPRLKQKLKDTTGIGTEATRANIIGGLLGRGYLLKKGRAIRASDAAFTLIDTVPAAIADPGTTAVWEQALDMIEAGQMTLDTFIAKQSAWVAQLVQQYRGATLAIKLPPSPSCPQCGAPMRQRTGKNGAFWSCSRYPDCKGTLPVDSSTGKRGAPRKQRASRKAS